LSFIIAMFSVGLQIVLCMFLLPASIGPPSRNRVCPRQADVADITCCLLC
jgi:hypothetical protein